jgi:hypothetical protein
VPGIFFCHYFHTAWIENDKEDLPMRPSPNRVILLLLCWACATVAQAITLYSSSLVEMRTLAAGPGAANDHPADNVDPTSLAQLLASLQLVSDATGKTVYLMSENDAKEVGAQLSKALTRVRPDQDIDLSVFRDTGGLLSARRYATGMRVFVKDGRINLIFGQVEVFLNDFREPYTKLPEPGSRAAVHLSGGRIVDQTWLQHVNGRPDWVSYAVAVAPGPRQSLRLRAQPAAAPVRPPAATSRPAPAAPVAEPAPAPKSQARPGRWKDLEEGLETLDRLHRKGLISDDEYRADRAKLMRGVGL